MFTHLLIGALLNAVVTLGLAALVYLLVLRPALDRRLEQLAQEIETRVQRGVEAAGYEMLPAFRTQVREGFLEAIAQWPSSEFRNVTRTGAGLVEDGLNSLFGRRRKD